VNSRRAITLLLLVCIALASLCLVPAGHGPYSVVYGPRAPLRAYRASLQLMQAVVAIVIVSMAVPILRFWRSRFTHVTPDDSAPAALFSSTAILRC